MDERSGPERVGGRRAARQLDPSLFLRGTSQHAPALVRILLRAAMLLVPLLLLAWGLEALGPRLTALRARRRAPAPAPELARAEPRGGLVEAAPVDQPPPTPEEIAKNQRSWIDSVSIAPRSERTDPDTGERIGDFMGFGLQIDRPAGATVWVDAEEKGTAPLLTTVACTPGRAVQVVVERDGRRATASTRCRRDTLVKLELELPSAAQRR